jgi:hypothetical protein
MSINIILLVQGALTESLLQQLATRLGVAPEAAKRVVGAGGAIPGRFADEQGRVARRRAQPVRDNYVA